MEKDILKPSITYKLYNTRAFSIATLLGGPLAAAYMASVNFKFLGDNKKPRYAWGIAVLLILFAIAAPEIFPALNVMPSIVYVLLFLLVIQILVSSHLRSHITKHIDEGGEVYPTSRAVMVGLISMVSLFAFILGSLFLAELFGGAAG